ncbi:DUF3160 domain-containing protein, partial [candidate division KSB1 bacterium]|nr:DUF3160 domain-containing protein [candidate division KSB1 bacterium]
MIIRIRSFGFIFILIIISSLNIYAQSTMIAEIDDNVETDFGTYHPYRVDIIPNITDYLVEDDLTNVVNYTNFRLSDDQKSLLKSHHFVVSPFETTYNEIFDVYNSLREQDVPIFVTTDAMLHTFHLCFDYILMTIETKRFATDLRLLLDELIYQTTQQLAETTQSSLQDALTRNLNFLYVATHLLDSTYVPAIPDQVYYDELQLIANRAQPDYSPIFLYEEDYTQYIPRGHYTRSDT